MKKQASPSFARSAELAQSARRHAAETASAWQNIFSNSLRLPKTNRCFNRTSCASFAPGQDSAPESMNSHIPIGASYVPVQKPEPEGTIQQLGWCEVERAVRVNTKRKYNFLGIGFGPTLSVLVIEKVIVPVYQDNACQNNNWATKIIS